VAQLSSSVPLVSSGLGCVDKDGDAFLRALGDTAISIEVGAAKNKSQYAISVLRNSVVKVGLRVLFNLGRCGAEAITASDPEGGERYGR
jgi:hypothetical protein